MWTKGCTHALTAAFHLQTRDTHGGMVPLLREQQGQREREEGQTVTGLQV